MNFHDLGLAFFAFVSEILGTISGFGSSTFFLPIALFFESMHLVLAITAILHCFSNFSKITLFHGHFSWPLFWKLALPFIVLTGIGAVMTNWFLAEHLMHALGIFLITISMLFLIAKKYVHRMPFGLGVALSGLSGFSTGLLGTGGALRGLALSAIAIEKNQFILMSSAMDMGGDLLRAGIYIYHGYMDWTHWFYIPLLACAAFLGAWSGKKILHKIEQKHFENIVIVMVCISGVMLLFQ
jgi:uncharacterized membrane protein YfcA